MHRLNPPVTKICKEPKQRLEKCLQGVSPPDGKSQTAKIPECQSWLEASEKCETVVVRAYRSINMGGCVREIESEEICSEECDDNPKSSECNQNCKKEKDALASCVKSYLQRYFQKAGIDVDMID